MHDPAEGEEAHEQTGPLVRPYIAGEARNDAEGDRFWSEEHDEAALAATPEQQIQGQAQGEQADHGDVLAEDWRPDTEKPATERPATVVLESSGESEPRGFLGSGWRNAPDPEDDEVDAYGDEEDSRRGGMLLRAGLIGVGLVAAIWALALWVGSPAEPACGPGGASGASGCAAGAPATSLTPTPGGASGDSATGDDSGDDAALADPGTGDDNPSPAAPTPGTTTTRAPSRDTSARTQDTGPRAGASPRPTRSRGPVRSRPPVTVDEPSEAPTTVAPTNEPTSEPTTAPAPAPTQEAPRRGGGILDLIF
ncbi:hypothetical protein F5972_11415 [Microbispora cellulosiformans]|uniref:Uncharacterized protein n=1 Tax=Microbispora cellulosiformans TaxID=2614688 RepID=A0A5J5K5T7_9ACTN|nr:hypothetical protein [Microbispora cellulosiformans]KAA9378846.1 hypothetical protein F5972_11415 [Microbispora cellulosiformans]